MEYLFSETILAFLKRIKQLSKIILNSETNIKVWGNRIHYGNYTYALHYVAFEHPNMLGFFKGETLEIGLNKSLIITAKDFPLKNLIRHELAHFLTFLNYGITEHSHGKEFLSICRKYDWNKEISSATCDIAKQNISSPNKKQEALLSKVQKLLSLGSSHNSYESELATLKANELLIKYNLSPLSLSDEQEMALKRILSSKRISEKMRSISTILGEFFVFTVFNHGSQKSYLELYGKKNNVLIAEYVAFFLNEEFERLWQQTKAKHPNLRGIRSKHSFYRGLAEGYCLKMRLQKEKATHHHKQALIAINQDLTHAIPWAYPRLHSSVRSINECRKASKLGKEEGKRLHIKKAIFQENGNKALSYQRK